MKTLLIQRLEDFCKLRDIRDTCWLVQPGCSVGKAKCNLETVNCCMKTTVESYGNGKGRNVHSKL